MVDYGEQQPDEVATSTHIHRAERKYRGHKLAQGVNHINLLRHHGESAKPHTKGAKQKHK